MTSTELARTLRVLVITDSRLAGPRGVIAVVAEALRGGALAIQLRNKGGSLRDSMAAGTEIRTLCHQAGALLFVNDRLDLALALEADGVHLGPEDLPVAAARRVAPAGFLIGRSADDAEVARAAVRDGADYIGCGTVFPTSTKADAGDVIGLAGLANVVAAVSVPVVGIGGITRERARSVLETGAAGVAVVGAVMSAADPAAAVRELADAF